MCWTSRPPAIGPAAVDAPMTAPQRASPSPEVGTEGTPLAEPARGNIDLTIRLGKHRKSVISRIGEIEAKRRIEANCVWTGPRKTSLV